jgi:hypothetical protein
MLEQTYQRTERDNPDPVINNALIEAFCLHARNLIEFFKKKANTYTGKNYKPFSQISGECLEKIKTRLNTQIVHLIYEGRTVVDSEKIDLKNRAEMLNILSAEIAQFKANLLPEYQHIAIPNLARVPMTFEQGTTTTFSTDMGLYYSHRPDGG